MVKVVGNNPGIFYGLCKIHKAVVDMSLSFRQLAKYLVPELASITAIEFSVKDSFCLSEDIVNQNSNFIMGSLDVDSLFTNIPLEETINICCDTPFKEIDIYEGCSKSEFKTLLSLESKESYFSFNKVLYKQREGVAMGSPLGPTLANAFLSHYEKNWLERCHQEIKPLFCRKYVDGIFVLFESEDKLIKFRCLSS